MGGGVERRGLMMAAVVAVVGVWASWGPYGETVSEIWGPWPLRESFAGVEVAEEGEKRGLSAFWQHDMRVEVKSGSGFSWEAYTSSVFGRYSEGIMTFLAAAAQRKGSATHLQHAKLFQYASFLALGAAWNVEAAPISAPVSDPSFTPRSGSVPKLRDIIVENDGTILCRSCGAVIGHIHDELRFESDANSKDATRLDDRPEHPLLRHFRNPNGKDFNVVTMKKAVGRAQGKLRSEASFFQHFEWDMFHCAGCGAHLGWKFSPDPLVCGSLFPESEAENAQMEPPDQDTTVATVIKSLDGVCLVKHAGRVTYEWCVDGSLTLIDTQSGSHVELARHESNQQAPPKTPLQMMLGDRPRAYHAIRMKQGEVCQVKSDGTQVRFSAQIQLLCCDSFLVTEHNAEELQRRHLRIELVQRNGPCAHVVTVCVPKLCMLNHFQFQVRVPQEPTKQDSKVKATTSSAAPCSAGHFYGLVWDNVLMLGSTEASWLDSVEASL